MTIEFVKRDLFTMPQGYYLAHCISGDFKLGAGIAKMFDNIYDMRFKLSKASPNFEYLSHGETILVDNVFNLITKDKYWHKPTYESLREALEHVAEICEEKHITKLAMPKIGCGLDKLDWDKVYDIIEEVFEDADISIVICEL